MKNNYSADFSLTFSEFQPKWDPKYLLNYWGHSPINDHWRAKIIIFENAFYGKCVDCLFYVISESLQTQSFGMTMTLSTSMTHAPSFLPPPLQEMNKWTYYNLATISATMICNIFTSLISKYNSHVQHTCNMLWRMKYSKYNLVNFFSASITRRWLHRFIIHSCNLFSQRLIIRSA